MLLGFKRRFAPFVLDGSKRHTIRAKRKICPRVGEVCNCYVDPRQKTMKLLGRWPCVRVQTIRIEEVCLPNETHRVWIDGVPLMYDERDALAIADGFPNGFDEMMEFWQGRLPFKGQIIHWNFEKPLYKNGNHYGAKKL